MDTRSKILSAESAFEVACRVKQQGRKLTLVTGYFDLLQASSIRDLAEVKKGTGEGVLMAVLLPHGGSLLAPRARAELLAGLGMIDYVVIDGDGGALAGRLAADEVISRQTDDEEQTRLLMEHVHARHSV